MSDYLSRALVVAIVLVAMGSIAGCLDTATFWSVETASETEQPATINATAVEMWIHAFVNEERQARGLDPLTRNDTLDAITRYHSTDMVEHGYYAHESPSGETMEDRYVKFGADCWESYGETRYLRGAENIAQTYHHTRVNATGGDVRYHETAKEVARAASSING